MAPESTYTHAVAALTARGRGRMIPDLDRIHALTALLGDPQQAYPSIHVTGTNGKSSVVRMVSALCAASGIAPGTYTSPHLQTVRERLAVAGQRISEPRFAELYEEVALYADLVDANLDRPDDHVTYFELVTAMAFAWFADLPVDVAVVEVGMGGRWDATNVLNTAVAVLTPIDVDHRELGATAVDVAAEKSGIIKAGADVVLGRQSDAVLAVIEAAAAEVGAPVRQWGTDHDVVDRKVAVGGQAMSLRVGSRVIEEIHLPLFGAHQADNAAVALAAFASLRGAGFDEVDDDVIRSGFAAVRVPGRLEVAAVEPTVLIDGAHNPHGARAAAAAVAEAFGFRNLIVVLACLDDKDVDGIISPFVAHAAHVVVTRAPSARAASIERMQAAAESAFAGTGVVVEVGADLLEALDKATGVAGVGDGVLVTGSLFTVGAARDRYLPITDHGEPELVLDDDDLDGEPDEAAEAVHDAEYTAALDDMLEHADDDPMDDLGDGDIDPWA